MPERKCRFRRCVAQTGHGARCKNCIDVQKFPDLVFCWVHRTRLIMPVETAEDVARSVGAAPSTVRSVQEDFERMLRRQGAGWVDVMPYLCCSVPEYSALAHAFRAISRMRIDARPEVLLVLGFLVFYATVKLEQTELDLRIKNVWRDTPARDLVSFERFQRLFFELGLDPDVRGVLVGRKRIRRRGRVPIEISGGRGGRSVSSCRPSRLFSGPSPPR